MAVKRVLVLSDNASLQDLNNRSNLNILISMDCEIHIGCNFLYGNTTSPERVYAFRDELEAAGIVCHQLSFVPSENPLAKQSKAAAELEGIIKEYEFDLIHCLTLSSLQCAGPAAKAQKIPVICTSYGFPVHKGVSFLKKAALLPKMKKASEYADVMICCNKEDCLLAEKKLSAKHTIRIPGTGLDPYRFRAPAEDRFRMRDLMEIPQNSVAIITVGPLTAEKNHAVVLKAISHLRMLELHYVICGAGPKADSLYKLTQKLHLEDRVHFAKNRDDIVNMLHACDIFCLPSKEEGIGMAALEAMEAGLPLVTSNVQGIADFMEDGVTGFSFDPDDVMGFVAGIEALTEDKGLRKHIGEHNRYAVEPFYRGNVEYIMKQVYEIQLEYSEKTEKKTRKQKKTARKA